MSRLIDRIKLRPFKAADFHGMELRSEDKGLRQQDGYIDYLRQNEVPGFCYTAVLDGEIIGCGGVRPFWEGVGEAWAFFPADKVGFKREIFYAAKKVLDTVVNEQKMHRVQAVVRCDFIAALGFMKHLGFVVEAKMIGFNDDKTDAYLYRRVTNG